MKDLKQLEFSRLDRIPSEVALERLIYQVPELKDRETIESALQDFERMRPDEADRARTFRMRFGLQEGSPSPEEMRQISLRLPVTRLTLVTVISSLRRIIRVRDRKKRASGIRDEPLDALLISRPTLNALSNGGLDSVRDLIDLTETELSTRARIGPHTMSEIQDALAAHKLRLKKA